MSASPGPTVGSLRAFAEAVAADLAARGVPVTVYFGQEYKAQDDAGNRIVFIPSRDSYSLERHMGGMNPKPIRTRGYGCTVQIWSKAETQTSPADQPAAEWDAHDVLLNAFLVSVMNVSNNNWELGEGVHNQRIAHMQYGRMYELALTLYVPIVNVPWEVVSDGKPGGNVYLVFPDGPQPVAPGSPDLLDVASTITGPTSDISLLDS